eukprot:jgi/Tetstr1/433968/TSEL_023145.t1
MKGSVRPIGIGNVLVRYAMRVLLRADGEPIAQWFAAPGQFGFGVKGGVELDASYIGATALVVGQAVTFLRAQHATLSDAGAFFSDPSGVSSPHSLYLVGASSIHQALATPTLEPDAGANASAPMWAVELRAAHTRVVDECGDAVLEDLAGPLASALKLLPSKRSHAARACRMLGRRG